MFGQRELDSTDSTSSQAPSAPAVPTMPSMTSSPLDTPTTSPSLAPATLPTMPTFSSSMLDTPAAAPVSVSVPMTMTPASDEATTADDLVNMKQEALKHLQPLVDTLQQSPEEEFRTIMMMIQATDDKTMLKKALDSAKKITDDKVRAQAMLDVINEINYFTQTSSQEQ